MVRYPTRPGTRFPAGATPQPEGVNFCVFGRHATRVELLLYADADSAEPFQIVPLSADQHRSYFFWHVFVVGLPLRTWYTWRLDGLEIVDPWALAVSDVRWRRRAVAGGPDGPHDTIRAAVTAPPPLRPEPRVPRSLEGAVIYELHVGGFTQHPSSGVAHPGTFAGLIEKIPYLRDLGITHVELLPVMAFDEQNVPPAVAARGLRNYWGYSPHSFFSPHPRYCLEPVQGPHEVRALVDALHEANIGVLLDVVFNHTAEGGEDGPVINFKGLGGDTFYHVDRVDRRRFRDYTGCGNTVNCNHPLVTAFIRRSLESWAALGVDGFRFDLASVFARDQSGALMDDPPLPWAIESSPSLARMALIAEAWDAGGLYQVGAFPGMAWAEWNGRYRDAVRRFVRGEPGLVGEVATRIAGSADMYAGGGRLPCNSINFITCHDGFTLHDLVSYDTKHNWANGEHNQDGTNDHLSWNCGHEGETSDPAILARRSRQAKNMLAILLLSRGVPMLLAGDEVLRSQGGNNNGWCQDNQVSWFDWTLTERNHDMRRFAREMIALRRRHPSLIANRFFTGTPAREGGLPDITWHGVRLEEPPWHDPHARVLRFTVAAVDPDEEHLHVVLNMADEPAKVLLPAAGDRSWSLAVDTAQSAPEDIVPREQQRPHAAPSYAVTARSVVVFEARPQGTSIA